ncbi:hypothetical protein DENSPDRAFT_677128 [Dentipellis sp. KUC8613]|nr:hypothetical protein DENSPDRAFT_677128 [Dentipellis sp. KUC8613]
MSGSRRRRREHLRPLLGLTPRVKVGRDTRRGRWREVAHQRRLFLRRQRLRRAARALCGWRIRPRRDGDGHHLRLGLRLGGVRGHVGAVARYGGREGDGGDVGRVHARLHLAVAHAAGDAHGGAGGAGPRRRLRLDGEDLPVVAAVIAVVRGRGWPVEAHGALAGVHTLQGVLRCRIVQRGVVGDDRAWLEDATRVRRRATARWRPTSAVGAREVVRGLHGGETSHVGGEGGTCAAEDGRAAASACVGRSTAAAGAWRRIAAERGRAQFICLEGPLVDGVDEELVRVGVEGVFVGPFGVGWVRDWLLVSSDDGRVRVLGGEERAAHCLKSERVLNKGKRRGEEGV